MDKTTRLLSASFRDPSGFLFRRDGILFRQINQSYALNYHLLMESGLYGRLVELELLVPHQESHITPLNPSLAFKVIRPQEIPFISYPYEWSFSMFKDAALVTLKIQKIALEYGMSLKDASAYNIQFKNSRPLLIDTLSFEKYDEGKPWVAYRQFCQHFLAPLSLMAYRDVRLGQLMRVYIDGIPLDLASRLLPFRTLLDFGLLSHIHLHAYSQRKFSGRNYMRVQSSALRMSKQSLIGLIENLESTVRKLKWKPGRTEWGDYYSKTNYTKSALEHKREIISDWIERIRPASVWDLGANDGTFSRLASTRGALTVAFDLDPTAVENNYRQIKARGESNLIPLLLDLTNPSPALGWHNRERYSLMDRGPVDMVLALALIHHLVISNNVPMHRLAEFFADLGHWLIIEFVPKSDTQVQKLLASREDIFTTYTQHGFEENFVKFFYIHQSIPIRETERRLYLMEKRREMK